MKLNIVLKKGGQLFPVVGDSLYLNAPTKLEVIKRTENGIIFEVTELNKPNPENYHETLTEVSSALSS